MKRPFVTVVNPSPAPPSGDLGARDAPAAAESARTTPLPQSGPLGKLRATAGWGVSFASAYDARRLQVEHEADFMTVMALRRPDKWTAFRPSLYVKISLQMPSVNNILAFMKGLRHFRKAFAVLMLCLLSLPALSAPYNLGSLQFHTGPPSGPLLQKMLKPSSSSQGSLGSYDFVGKVGGVAFAGVAVPEAPFKPQKICVFYDPSKPDGTRLIVSFDVLTVSPTLPDWMLIPIAGYSNSEFNACVSLFGAETTATQYDIIYHPAFLNTLIGLRLLHADILLFDLNETWKLPKIGEFTPLGLGEREPYAMNVDAATTIQNTMARRQFQSWVFTDGDSETQFFTGSGNLRFIGDPYYHFWKSDMAAYQRERNALVSQANAVRGDVAQYNAIVSKANSLEPKVYPLSDLTKQMRLNTKALSDFNPEVYNAAVNTMRYSAFFRYVKEQNPANWASFLESIRSVTLRPTIETPTKWKR